MPYLAHSSFPSPTACLKSLPSKFLSKIGLLASLLMEEGKRPVHNPDSRLCLYLQVSNCRRHPAVAPIALLILNNPIFNVRLNVQSILYIKSLLPFGGRLKSSLSGLILRVLSHAPIALLFIRV